MKQSTRLSSVVFQLTPTRTRCDLFVIANDKKEKIASGLLNPFLAHLKTAQDQIAKGGYSILLEPEKSSDASWFTKATLDRFVRFVSTPEILERVYTIETEILQIEEAIAIQSSSEITQNIVENHGTKSLGVYEGDKSFRNANEEKAIVLYVPGAALPEDESCSHEENSRIQLLKVLETRKTVLQKEQGMAFARAVAAGFDIDYMAHLVSFAACFGALRLMQASSRFIHLWKSKHEAGQLLTIEASEALSARSDFRGVNTSSIILADTLNKHEEPYHELTSENNAKSGSTNYADNPVPSDQQEYFQGQFPHIVVPPWPMHTPPGSCPVFPAYPLEGIPYCQTYANNGSIFQPHHYHMEHSSSNFSLHSGQKKQSLDVKNSNSGSEMREADRRRSLDDMASVAEVSNSQKLYKKSGGSNKEQPGKVVIKNINYFTAKEKKSDTETDSVSQPDIDTENEYFIGNHVIDQNKKRSSRHEGSHVNNDKVSILGKDTDTSHWQAFQDCLLRGSDEGAHADNEGIFTMERGVKMKRYTKTASEDSLALYGRDRGEIQDDRMEDIHGINGGASRKLMGAGDEFIFCSSGNDFRGNNDQTDIQFSENNGKNFCKTTKEDSVINSHGNQASFRNLLDPLALYSFENASIKKNNDSLHRMSDETLVVPLRLMSLDQIGETDRIAIDIGSEIPAKYQKWGSVGNTNRVNYEANDLSLMPERDIVKRPIGYDIGLEYEMQVCAQAPDEKGKTNVTDMKVESSKSDKNRMSKVGSESLHKQRTGGPLRKTKPSKRDPLEDARARAERLRSYKADLQKMKKEKEEAEAKRLEALKLQRQKRIAARVGSNSVKPSAVSPQTKQLPAKFSTTTNRGSKFSDSEPGSSSPLQRSKVRVPVGSSEPRIALKSSKLYKGSHMVEITRSLSSLPETGRESDGVTPDSKAAMSRIRRLSEPKTITSSSITTVKARSAKPVLKRKLSEGPERNNVSAIIDLDRSKTATLPELKIKTSKSHVNACENRSEVKDRQKINGIRPSMLPEDGEVNVNDCDTSHQIDSDGNPIVEKTVLVLECEKHYFPNLYSSGHPEVQNQQHYICSKGEKSNVTSKSARIHAPPPMDGIDRETVICAQKQPDHNEVKTLDPKKDPPNFANTTTAGNPYRAPARVSSLDDPCTHTTEYGKAPLGSAEMLSRAEGTVRTHVPDVKALKTDKNQVNSEKIFVKESSKGFKRLLKFGTKNHSSSSVDQSIDSECTSGDGVEHKDSAPKMTSTSEVDTLKNLISQDETAAAGNAPQKLSRHFSLFSRFRRNR